MEDGGYVSIPQMAKMLGISRIAVYRKVKKGQIKAIRIGRNFAIPKRYTVDIIGSGLKEEDKKEIDAAVGKTVREYADVLRLLGRG